VLKEEPYGQQVDWWTVGTLLFEMLTGLPPFYDEDRQDMYQKILHQPLEFEEYMSLPVGAVVHLCCHLPAAYLPHVR